MRKKKSNIFLTKVFQPLERLVTTDYYWEIKNKKFWKIEFDAKDWITDKVEYHAKIILDHNEEKEETDTFFFLFDDKNREVFSAAFINKKPRETVMIKKFMENPEFWAGKPTKEYR